MLLEVEVEVVVVVVVVFSAGEIDKRCVTPISIRRDCAFLGSSGKSLKEENEVKTKFEINTKCKVKQNTNLVINNLSGTIATVSTK